MATFLQKQEQYDPDNLKLLLTHDGIDRDTKRRLKQYKKMSMDGNKILVKYNYPKKKYANDQIGRIYADKGLSLQMFERNIRACLGSKYYIDCDLTNCHTNIIKKIAEDHGLKYKALEYYAKNTQAVREEIARNYDCDINQAKQILLVVMYGGKINVNKNPILKSLKSEIVKIANFIYNNEKYSNIKRISEKGSDELNDFHNNLSQIVRKTDLIDEYDKNKASVMALVIQSEELKCNLALDKSLTAQGRQVDVLIHDGCLVKKLDPLEMELPEIVLKQAEADIYSNTGYEMKLVCKQMYSNFILNNNIPTVDFMNDDHAAGHLYRLIENKIIKSRESYWVFDDMTGTWTDDHDVLKKLIHINSKHLIFNVCDNKNNFNLQDYGGMVYNIERMIKQLSNFCPKDKDFIENNIDSSLGKLHFSNGIYDFDTDTFNPDFDPKIISLYSINKPWLADRDEFAISQVHKVLFEDPFADTDQEIVSELKKHLATSIAGKYRSRQFRIAVGKYGSSGKGTLCEALKKTFGDYVKGFNGANLFDKSNINTDDEKKSAWKLDLAYKRMAYSNEISMSGNLDGNLMKSVSSGGDEFDARKNFKDPITSRFRCQLWMMLNDVPKIKPYDAALDRRLTCFEYKTVFVSDPDPDDIYQKKENSELKNMFNDTKYQYALFNILCDSYQMYKREGYLTSPQLDQPKSEWLRIHNALLFLLNEKYDLTMSENDFVPYKELEDYVIKESHYPITEKKLPRELTALGFKSKDKKIDGKKTTCRLGITNKL